METKERILMAAREIFGQKGFYETKMDDIAKEAGIAKGTLYLYFKSKEELYECLIKTGLNYIQEKVSEIVNSSKPFLDKLQDLIFFIVDVLNENKEFILRIMYEMPLVKVWDGDFKQRFFVEGFKLSDSFKVFVVEGIEKGFLRDADPDLLAQVLIGAITRPIFVFFMEKRDMEKLKFELFNFIKASFCKL